MVMDFHGYNADDQPEHECDDWGHCMHSPTSENLELNKIFGLADDGYPLVEGCPLCIPCGFLGCVWSKGHAGWCSDGKGQRWIA